MNLLRISACVTVALGVLIFIALEFVSGKPSSDIAVLAIIGVICFGLGFAIRGFKINSN